MSKRGSYPCPSGDTSYSKRAGSLRRKEAVREALIAALESCPLSREQIADEMSRLTGEAISINHINNWTATAKKDWRFPLEYASALMVITKDFGIIDAVIGGTRLSVMTEEEAAYVAVILMATIYKEGYL